MAHDYISVHGHQFVSICICKKKKLELSTNSELKKIKAVYIVAVTYTGYFTLVDITLIIFTKQRPGTDTDRYTISLSH